MRNFFILFIMTQSMITGGFAFAKTSTDPFAEFKNPKNTACENLDLFLKQTMNLKAAVLKELDSGNITLQLTAEELYPLAIKKTSRSEIFERCGSEVYELHNSLGELIEKTSAERKEKKPFLIEKLGDWKSCLNEMTKSKLTADTLTVIDCYEKVVRQL